MEAERDRVLIRPPLAKLGFGERVAFSLDGRQLITGGEDNAVKIWDANTGQDRHTQLGHTGGVWAGLTTAIDSTPLSADALNGGVLTLEYDLSFPQPGLGRLQSFIVPTSNGVMHSTCLVTPSSMLID